MKRPGPREMLRVLAEIVAVTPEDAGRCHHCLMPEGALHDSECPWVEAAVLVRGDDLARRQLVGEEDEDLEDRLEDELEENPDYLRSNASEARAALARELGGLPDGLDLARVPADREILDDPLGAGEPFKPKP